MASIWSILLHCLCTTSAGACKSQGTARQDARPFHKRWAAMPLPIGLMEMHFLEKHKALMLHSPAGWGWWEHCPQAEETVSGLTFCEECKREGKNYTHGDQLAWRENKICPPAEDIKLEKYEEKKHTHSLILVCTFHSEEKVKGDLPRSGCKKSWYQVSELGYPPLHSYIPPHPLT